MKFGRSYSIMIKTPDGFLVTIEPPITAILSIDRHVAASQNNSSVTIYNLSENTRNKLFKDKYNTIQYWQMIISAGYGGNLYEVFKGNIIEAYSYKEKTEWITKIEAQDGAFAIQNGFTSTTIAAGTPKQETLSRIIQDMPNLLKGVLGTPAEGTADRGRVLVGPSYDIASEETDGNLFIDGEKINIVADDEVIGADVFLLDEENLFTTPKRRETYLEVDCMFSPEISVCKIVEIRSKEPRFNGQYKVLGIKHNATISEAMAGDAITTLSLYAGTGVFKKVIG